MKTLKLLSLFLLSIFMLSCTDEVNDRQLDFIGDSIVARWDLQEYFPSFRTRNYGFSGSKIDYIESMKGQFANHTVVILTGTNDSNLMTEKTREEYARRYVSAIVNLNAEKIYLYSVLPRAPKSYQPLINEDIKLFDALVKEQVSDIDNIVYINVYNDFLDGDKINPQYYNDGLHLSPFCYEILTKSLLKLL